MIFTKNIETQLMLEKIKHGKAMSELQFFASELSRFEFSPERREMLDGERYYSGNHDILHRKRTAIGKNGELTEVENLPNNRICDNQYAKHIDQKKNYLLGKPVSFNSPDDNYVRLVTDVLGKGFLRTLKNAGCSALNCGIAWLYPYYDDDGAFAFKYFPGYEILPFWKDAAHTQLDCAARLYLVEVYEGTERKTVKKVDIFKPDGLYTYTFDSGVLLPDEDRPRGSYLTLNTQKGAQQFNWTRIPLIAIKSNAAEIPNIRRAKHLQDTLNLLESDFANNMQEDVRNTILVLRNYDGTDLGEFRRNLSTYGAVKVRTVEGADGGVDTLEINVNAENYKTVLTVLKSALVENMRSFDGKDERLSSNPNQMNIQSLYADIDLDANDMETELQASFEEILWFVNRHLQHIGQKDYDGTVLDVIFNRDMLINESEAIDNCAKSAGIISDETIMAQHPWTKNASDELEKLKAQKEEAADSFGGAFAVQNPSGEEET